MKIIELDKVTKRYHHFIFSDLSLSFEEGKMYLLVGINGSGKTTLIKGILGIIKFDTGKVILNDHRIAFIPDYLSFPDFVSTYDFLYNIGLIRGLNPKVLEQSLVKLLHEWEMDHAKDKRIKELSKGMSQKVLIIQALLHDANIYIFDEPLNGLDKAMQRKFIRLVIDLQKQNKTIIIATHFPNSFIKKCDVIYEINQGIIYEKFNKMPL